MGVSAEAIGGNPFVQDMIAQARLNAEHKTSLLRMPWSDEPIAIHREGYYPFVTEEGDFDALLLRIIPTNGHEGFLGGEFRILANKHALNKEAKTALIISDTIPLFLKGMSDPRVQRDLANARRLVASYDDPAFLVQTRASDIHDGENRFTRAGQMDIREERWYAKILRVMHEYPGMTEWGARKVLVALGERPFFADFGLGAAAVLSYYFQNNGPERIITRVLDAGGMNNEEITHAASYLDPFIGDKGVGDQTYDLSHAEKANLKQKVEETVAENYRLICNPDGKKFHVRRLAQYTIMRKGVELQVQLILAMEDGAQGFQTFRIIEHGDRENAYYRFESACINGVQGGDTHCDCRAQIEEALGRVTDGFPIFIFNMLDQDGRNHGEGPKGGTLMLQRMLAKRLGIEIGNGIAAELYYKDTGRQVDARTYGDTQAVLQYLGIDYIPKLVTDNEAKISAIAQIARIGDIISAARYSDKRITNEARRTGEDKAAGHAGTKYRHFMQ